MKTLFKIIYICTFAVLVVAGCDGDDCPSCPDDKQPEERQYRFLYSHVDTGYWVHTISTTDGSTIDSVRYGEFPFWDMKYSSDGRYAFYTSTAANNGAYHATWVTDYLTGDTLTTLIGIGGHALSVSKDDKYLFVSSGGTAAVLALPDLNVLYADSLRHHFRGCLNPNTQIAYVTVDDIDSLWIIEFEAVNVSVTTTPLRNEDGTPVVGLDTQISADGEWLLLSTWAPSSGRHYFQLRLSRTFELYQEYYFLPPVAAVHPDGRRIFFVTGHLGSIDPPMDGAVYVLDLQTLLLRRVLDGADFAVPEPSRYGLSIDAMEITPDGKYGILMSGADSFINGPLYKVDLTTYEVKDVFFLKQCINRLIRMYPLEFK